MIRTARLGAWIVAVSLIAGTSPVGAQNIFRPQTEAERADARKVKPTPPHMGTPIPTFKTKPYAPRDTAAEIRGMGMGRLRMAQPASPGAATPRGRLTVPAGPPRRR